MTKHKFQDTAERLLASAGISINGLQPWDVQIHEERFYARVFAEGTVGFGEATWMAGGARPPSTKR